MHSAFVSYHAPSLSVSPRQLRLHETTAGCDKGDRTGPFAPLAPGGLVAAPAAGLRGDTFVLAPGGLRGGTFALAPGVLIAGAAAGLRGDNTGSSTTDFIGLDGSGPCTKKRAGGPLNPGDGETLEHGGSGKKQASAAAAASLALASAGQEMELLMHNHGDLEVKYKELQRKLDVVVNERDELEEKNVGLLAYKQGTAGRIGLAVLRKKREEAVLTVADDSTWESSSAGRRARHIAYGRAVAGVMSASSTLHQDGSCTASPTKLRAILERCR